MIVEFLVFHTGYRDTQFFRIGFHCLLGFQSCHSGNLSSPHLFCLCVTFSILGIFLLTYFLSNDFYFAGYFPSLYFRLLRLFWNYFRAVEEYYFWFWRWIWLVNARVIDQSHIFSLFVLQFQVTGHYLGLFSFLILHFPFHPSSIGHTLVAFKGHTDFSLSSVLYDATYFKKRMERWELLELVVV